MMVETTFENDIPLEIAVRAHAGTSHVPEQRGKQERASYAQTLMHDLKSLTPLATTDAKRDALGIEFEAYRAGYRKRFVAYLVTRSQAISTMIAGPSNFPVRRQQKRMAVEDRRREDLMEFRVKALARIRAVLTPESQPIRSGDTDALERLREKLTAVNDKRQRMRSANVVIRDAAKDGHAAQVAALAVLGFSESLADQLLEPDFAGRVGFPDYALTNAGAEARRLKARIAELEVTKAQPATESQGSGGVVLEDAPAKNRVRLRFPDKPDDEIRRRLKGAGFRWTPRLGVWQAYRNSSAVSFARSLAGISEEAP